MIERTGVRRPLVDFFETPNKHNQLFLPLTNLNQWTMKAIAAALESNKSVKSLNLSGNEIRGDVAIALGEMLKLNKGLTKLDLSYAKIDNSGAIAIAAGLENNTTLTSLNLSGNKIDEDGVAILLEVCVSIETLEYLCLNQCNQSVDEEMPDVELIGGQA